MTTISRLTPGTYPALLKDLSALLAGAVHDGASLGFLLPFTHQDAEAWWRTQPLAHTTIWAAHADDGRLTGTISLTRESKPNGRHRAEITKLIVHSSARRQGLARRLLATAEHAAAEAGVTLLLLDTESDSPAAHLYTATGWTPHGHVPAYATDPTGTPQPCTFFHKHLKASSRSASLAVAAEAADDARRS